MRCVRRYRMMATSTVGFVPQIYQASRGVKLCVPHRMPDDGKCGGRRRCIASHLPAHVAPGGKRGREAVK
jgi:hypothetical protein